MLLLVTLSTAYIMPTYCTGSTCRSPGKISTLASPASQLSGLTCQLVVTLLQQQRQPSPVLLQHDLRMG